MNNNLAAIRSAKGLTQTELAQKSGVSRTLINQLETGVKKVITSSTMIRLSQALETPVADIFLLK